MYEAIILAGGLGTRMHGVLEGIPKPMALINGYPFLQILLTNLAKKGFSKIILSLGYLPEKIKSFFGSNYMGMEIKYVIEETPLGTGGALRLAMTRCDQDYVFIFNGDTFLDLEVNFLYERWERKKNPIIVGRFVEETGRYGRLVVKNQRIINFSEKSEFGPGLINAGSYVLSSKQLDCYDLYQPFSLEKDFFARSVKEIHFEIFISHGFFVDIGIPEDYFRAQNKLVGYQ